MLFLRTYLKKTPDATVMSPVLWRGDGSLQFCGRGRCTFGGFVGGRLGFKIKKDNRYVDKEGIFKSYNVSGAAFLITTEEFRKIGFFDEKYFFCPEDIAVGETLNKLGKYCYVDANTNIIHYDGVSSRKGKLFYATTCAAYLGHFYFHGTTSYRRFIATFLYMYKYLQHKIGNAIKPSQHHKDYIYIYKRVVGSIRKGIGTKELFVEEYNKIMK